MSYLLFQTVQDEYETGPVQSGAFDPYVEEDKKSQEALAAWENLRDAVYERLRIPEMAQTVERFLKWMRSR